MSGPRLFEAVKATDADRIRAYAQAHAEAAYKAAGAGEMALRGNDFIVRAHCHQPDDRPSLRISRTKGTFYCDPCGKGGDIFDYLAETHGLNTQTDFPQIVAALIDLFHLENGASTHANGRNGRAPWVPPDRSYEIRDAEGELIATHHRWEARDGEPKRLAWQRAGNKKFSLAGLPVADLPLAGSERARGWTEKTTVIVTEGEPVAVRLLQRKIEAVATVCGAGSTPRDESLMVLLRAGEVILWSDNDARGREHMHRIGSRLLKLGLTPERLRWVDTGRVDGLQAEGADAADLDDDGVRAALETAVVPFSLIEAADVAPTGGVEEPGAALGQSAEPEPPTPYSEIALSNRFAGERGADFHYTKGSWWRYDEAGGLWLNDDTLRVFTEIKRFNTRVAREVCDAVAGEDENAQKAARRFASELTAAKKVAALEVLTRSHPAIVTTLDRFDRDIWTLNTPGGVVHLRDGTVRPTRRDDFFTKSTSVPPRDMPTPVFDRFIREIMGAQIPPAICKCASCAASLGRPDVERQALHDAEVQRLVEYSLRLYGYCLSGDVSNHILVMLVGDGGNGKTLLTDFIARDILGLAPIGYSASLPIEALLANKSDRHPTELMSLLHTRLALASEPSSGVSWNEGLVMRLSGGEPVTARGMRQDFITFPATHKLFVVGNTAPALRGGREPAWQRRLHMILFQQRWADHADPSNHVRLADASLREKLRPEAPGVLRKLVLGCVEYVRRGSLDPPATVRETGNNYLKQQNVIGRWLDERCDRSNPHATVTVAELWADLTRWGEAGREYVGKRNDFNGALERLGISITRLGTQRGICRGLALSPRGEEAS